MKRYLAWGDVAFFVAFAIIFVSRARWNLRDWTGLAVAVLGFALWVTARLQLGGSFSVRARAKMLVTTGLYARFRHPIYLFGFVAYVGVLMIWGQWIPFLCFLLLYSIELKRIRNEERVLEQTFGEEYRQYRARTWF